MKHPIKIIVALLCVAILAGLRCRSSKPSSPGEIEQLLTSANLPENKARNLLQAAIRHFEKQELSQTKLQSELAAIDSTLNRHSFLSKADTDFIENVVNPDRPQGEEFVRGNRYQLLVTILNLLNESARLRYRFPEKPDAINQKLVWAEQLISHYDMAAEKDFLYSEWRFYQTLGGEHLQHKLRLELFSKKSYELMNSHSKDAISYIASGLKLAKQRNDKRLEIDFLFFLQFVLYENFGYTSTALQLGKLLLEEIEKSGYQVKRRIVHYYNGNIHLDKGQLQQALQQYEHAKTLYETYNHTGMVIRMHERMGVVQRRLGQFDSSMVSYSCMLDLQKQFNERKAQIDYLMGIGLLEMERGEFKKARDTFRDGLKLARESHDTPRIATALGNLGELDSDVGEYGSAIDSTQKAIALIDLKESPILFLSLSMNLVEMLIENQQIGEANQQAELLHHYFTEYDFGILKIQNLLSLGKLQLEIGQRKRARNSFEQALVFAQKSELIASAITALNFIAETDRQLKNLDSAADTLEKALKLCNQFDVVNEKWRTLFFSARVQHDLNNLELAEKNLHGAIAMVKALASELANNEQRSSFSQLVQPVFEEMVLVQLDKQDTAKAFYYTEQERAQVFKILLQREAKASSQYTLEAGMQTAAVQRDFSPQQLQSQLDDTTVVVEYELTDSSLAIWVIGKDQFHAVKLDTPRAQIAGLISEFRDHTDPSKLTPLERLNRSYPQTLNLGRRFYDCLIAPVAKYLRNARLIYFVPDETLNYLPFAAVVTPEHRYLIEDYGIAVIPSAEILCDLLEHAAKQETSAPASGNLLAVAADTTLIYSVREAREVVKRHPHADTLIGKPATKMGLKNKLLIPYLAILFSTHGRINEKQAFYSALVLNKDSSAATDSLLTVTEIQQLNLDATEVVYLSACESASGRLYRGEGIVGLQRAFMIAGVNSVIANLWKIDDKASKPITVEFFKLWLSGKVSKIQALRRAQLHTISGLKKKAIYNNQPHPFLWAAVTLAGLYK